MSITGSCLEDICALGRGAGGGVPPCPSLGFFFPICNRTPLACVMPWAWVLPPLVRQACQPTFVRSAPDQRGTCPGFPYLPGSVGVEQEQDVHPHPYGGQRTTGELVQETAPLVPQTKAAPPHHTGVPRGHKWCSLRAGNTEWKDSQAVARYRRLPRALRLSWAPPSSAGRWWRAVILWRLLELLFNYYK